MKNEKNLKSNNPNAPLPIVRSIGIRKQPDGWVVYLLESQGEMIISREILGEGVSSKAMAENVFKMEVVRRFLIDKPGVKA